MISFACPACNKQLKVKDEAAGKKAKCPGCGKPVMVPENRAAALSEAGKQSPVPGPAADAEPTFAPKAPALPADADARTLPSSNRVGAGPLADASGGDTVSGVPHKAPGDHPAELTDFLAPAQADDELGRLGGYRILKILGHGGMGVVFQGEDPKLGRQVAIKAMLPHLANSKSSQQRFLREARAAAGLEHDHIVHINHVAEDRGVPFIVMPLLQGESLDNRLKREQRLPLAEVLRIGRETAAGLAAAHERGLIHRDIKPANLWLEARSSPLSLGGRGVGGEEFRVKILDFGLARAAADNAQLTSQGAILGTPAFMAPEQATGGAVDARCDLFSLGCVLYRMSTGHFPFKGADAISTLLSVASEKPVPPSEINPELPPDVCRLVMQLLAKHPDERPQSAQEVVVIAIVAILPPRGRDTKASDSAGPTDKGPGTENPPVAHVELLPAFANKLGMEFVLVPKGKSWLGGGKDKPGDKEVEIACDFYLGKYEVTQEEWDKLMMSNPNEFKAVPGVSKEDQKRFPVERVSWEDAQLFLGLLNNNEKEAGWRYRLPKQVEWEYACRGGPLSNRNQSAFDYYLDKPMNQITAKQANFQDGKGLKRTCKVGSYAPNALGLYDMHGNVWEWCDDAEKPGDAASRRMVRGGSWSFGAGDCRAVSIYPLWFQTSGPAQEALRRTAGQLRQVPHHGLSYGMLRYLDGNADVRQALQSAPDAAIRLNYIGQLDPLPMASTAIAPVHRTTGHIHQIEGTRRNLLECNGHVADGQLRLGLTYSSNLHDRETVARLVEAMLAEVRLLGGL